MGKIFDEEFFKKAGRKGGKATLKNRGTKHFSEIARKKRKDKD